jgi:RNA polymerase sigma-54 factor
MLKEIQTFDPPGVGATSLQESFLIQLERMGEKESLAFFIVARCYNDLLNNRMALIRRKKGCSTLELDKAMHMISKLDMHPGLGISKDVVQTIVPDVTLKQEGDQLVVEINDDQLPPLRLNPYYMNLFEQTSLSKETKDFMKDKILSAKWLVKSIHQRNQTLFRIAESLAQRQHDFFLNPQGQLTPLTMKTLAEELDVHESTIARAVANKSINTPKGILPLRSFFTGTYVTDEGHDISSKTVKDALLEIIKNENKHKPCSDEILKIQLKKKGIVCARRTIAKYRDEMNIGNTKQRRKI